MKRTLDRLPEFDERSREYPITAVLASTSLKSKTWRCDPRLDQGREGACVGFGWTHELAADPIRRKVDAKLARWIYDQAQHIDEWPGEDYEGTSVLAGAKVVQSLKRMDEYRWAFGVDDVLATLANHGPVVIGVPWKDSMFDTDAKGFLDTSGTTAGGHCVCLRGLTVTKKGVYVTGRNSWGGDWGVRGDFKMWAQDLDGLLREGGDACVPVRRR